METPYTLSANTIQGTNVYNSAGESLGHIEDVMLDLSGGHIMYAVISFGGFLGLGDKLFAVPVEAFIVNADDNNLILNVDQEFLEDAPGFDKNNWPETIDQGWLNTVYTYYEVDLYWTTV